jgi:riboflavin transporter FmnP
MLQLWLRRMLIFAIISNTMKKLINPIIFIVLAVILRLISHMPNVAPIAAMALFGGTYLNKKYALIVPLVSMFISDIFLGFHASMPMVYGSFFITGFIGLWLRNHKTMGTVIGASLASSVLFFLLTNFNFWYAMPLYPKTFAGMIEAYVAAIPFFRNTVLGDLCYTSLFFGSYELVFFALGKKVKAVTQ